MTTFYRLSPAADHVPYRQEQRRILRLPKTRDALLIATTAITVVDLGLLAWVLVEVFRRVA